MVYFQICFRFYQKEQKSIYGNYFIVNGKFFKWNFNKIQVKAFKKDHGRLNTIEVLGLYTCLNRDYLVILQSINSVFHYPNQLY